MPESLEDSVSGSAELIFPDDATGRTYRLEELSVYEPDEVRDRIGSDSVPEYGSWIPVTEQKTGSEAWLNAPSNLRAELVNSDVTAKELFEITVMEKGTGQSDPYRVAVTYPDRPDPESGQETIQGSSDA